MEQQERGYGEVPEKYVCSNCFENPGIKKYIIKNACKRTCSYCSTHSQAYISILLEDLISFISYNINRYYEKAIETLPYDSSEGGFIGDTFSLNDILEDLEFEITAPRLKYKELYNDIVTSFDQEIWTPNSFGETFESEVAIHGWEEFCKQVKHNSRFMFANISYNKDKFSWGKNITPAQMLPLIHNFIEQQKLLKLIPKGEIFYRGRIVDKKFHPTFSWAKELGAPKANDAKYPNRMSPAGIPMFYGSDDKETIIDEIKENQSISEKKKLIIGKFKLLNDIWIIDLFNKPQFCLFDETEDKKNLNAKIFLSNFIREITKPIKKDGREHIEYVPSQIVTEYLKYKCLDKNKERIKGIEFPSSKNDKKNYVLFMRNKNCVDSEKKDDEGFLLLEGHETIDL